MDSAELARSSTRARTASPRSSTRSPRRRTTTAPRSAASPATPTGTTRRSASAMLVGRFLLIVPVLAIAGLARPASSRSRLGRHVPDRHAAVRRAARRRRRHRRRPHVLPRPRPRADRRAPGHLSDATRPRATLRPADRRGRPRRRQRRASSTRAHMARNPVMFVVEIGSVLVTVLFLRDFGDATSGASSPGWSPLWLWFTVLFANFAEAVAEGRGKAQADTLRETRTETIAHRRRADGSRRGGARARSLRAGDVVVVAAGEVIPGDGDVDRGHRHRRRVGDHRRVGAGHPRVGRRPLGGDRRHAGALRPDRRAHHVAARRDASSTA